jgi:hypothetical protein
MHVHISCPDGEAKFWIEPIISLATYRGLNKKQLNQMQLYRNNLKNRFLSASDSHRFSSRLHR